MKHYNPNEIEPKWQKKWRESKAYQPDLRKAKKPFYNLMMFPYPSGEGLHVGNMYAFTGADIRGRYMRMRGFDVFEPIGLDGFGIHSENYAIKLGRHPAEVAKETEKTFYRQLEATGNAYAWDNALETYDPDYYRWTQWVFTQMFKHGLAYRKKSTINWCPSCKTVLADEQVISDRCERCSSQVKPKKLEQWFFKITKYAERLNKNLEWIDWSERVKIGQENWIGKSKGLEEKWPVEGMDLELKTFTTWPHTTWGATFMVIAPEHPIITRLVKGTKYEKGANAFCKKAIQNKIKDPQNVEKNKEGYFLGRYVINHLNQRRMPLYIANFAIYEYGTGIVKCTPTHDQRDFEFAKKYDLDFVPVIKQEKNKPLDPKTMKEAYVGEGLMMNAQQFNDMPTGEARKAIGEYTVKQGHGRWVTNYKLRDWCISRQRYWGPPIPMINCSKCGWVPVPVKDLPVVLPELEDFQPKGVGKSPLAQLEDWVKVPCPECGQEAQRETDVSDTFLDSAWYFFRYPSVGRNDQPFDKKLTSKWLPVDMYIGGAEHTVLHLMYSRFVTMAFKDFGLIDFEEPYKEFYAHGLISKDGAKMSKSKGNVVIPDEYIKKFGADTLRMYLMFIGPFSHGGDFTDGGIGGIWRFLNRVWTMVGEGPKRKETKNLDPETTRMMHRTIKKATEDIEKLNYNTAIAALMEYMNFLRRKSGRVRKETIETLILLLAPFAPFITEELWFRLKASENTSDGGRPESLKLGNSKQDTLADSEFRTGKKTTVSSSSEVKGGSLRSIHQQPWPKYDPKLIKEEKVTIVIQVNGKVRGQIKLLSDQAAKQPSVEKLAKKEPNVAKHLRDKKIKSLVFVKSKLLNFVI